jgi:hypothetical protein
MFLTGVMEIFGWGVAAVGSDDRRAIDRESGCVCGQTDVVTFVIYVACGFPVSTRKCLRHKGKSIEVTMFS